MSESRSDNTRSRTIDRPTALAAGTAPWCGTLRSGDSRRSCARISSRRRGPSVEGTRWCRSRQRCCAAGEGFRTLLTVHNRSVGNSKRASTGYSAALLRPQLPMDGDHCPWNDETMALRDYPPKRLFQQTPGPPVSRSRQCAAATTGPHASPRPRTHGA